MFAAIFTLARSRWLMQSDCGEVDHVLTVTADQIFGDECAGLIEDEVPRFPSPQMALSNDPAVSIAQSLGDRLHHVILIKDFDAWIGRISRRTETRSYCYHSGINIMPLNADLIVKYTVFL